MASSTIEENTISEIMNAFKSTKKRSNDALAIRAYQELSDKKFGIDKKLEDKLYEYKHGKELDFEKSKKKKKEEAYEEELKFLRLKYEMADTLEAKNEAKKQLRETKRKKDFKDYISKLASQTFANMANALVKGVDTYLDSYSQYMTGIEARLQNSGKTFSNITKTISNNIGASQYVSQSKVLENLNKMVDQGIAYNVEQRAFLETLSEKIATTFDATDGTLLRLIRLQQADSTAARLGLEANLTKFFNKTFKDTSYLNSLSDAVAEALLNASSQMSVSDALSFESTVQSWLGSLSSVGTSDSVIQMLAQGLNYLGTGDVNNLSNNNALQTLLVLASGRAGLNYSSMLTNGLTAESTNTLLYSMVDYLQSIASIENNVVKSQYANLFGMTIADLTSILNLSTEDLVSISNNMLTYSQAIKEVNDQINSIPSRMTLKNRMDTLIDNIFISVGEDIANSAAKYSTWVINNMVESATGGIPIPSIFAMGSGIDLKTNFNQVLKLGIVGVSTLSKITEIFAGLTGINNLSLNDWGAESTLNRGEGFNRLNGTSLRATSSASTYIGNSSSSDIYQSSVANAKEEAKTIAGEEEQINVSELIANSIEPNVGYIKDYLQEMRDTLTRIQEQI